jgi:hypothetical protein
MSEPEEELKISVIQKFINNMKGNLPDGLRLHVAEGEKQVNIMFGPKPLMTFSEPFLRNMDDNVYPFVGMMINGMKDSFCDECKRFCWFLARKVETGEVVSDVEFMMPKVDEKAENPLDVV